MRILNLVAAGVVGMCVGAATAQDKPAAPQPKAPVAPQPEKPATPVGPPVTKPDGLVIEDLKIGDGAEAKAGSAIAVKYVGTLKATGAEFSSTTDTFGCVLKEGPGGVIAGWVEGVPGMKVGGKRKLTIPAPLAYKDQEKKDGDKVLIPANSDLVFEIELLDMLQIEDVKVGDGEEAKSNSGVMAHYKGTLKTEGTEFDSSYRHNAPVSFSLAFVIKGWQEGVPGMRVGGKRKLTVPAALAYGARGRPGIPPNADLVFEIELVAVEQVEDLKVGDGPVVRPGATVSVHYVGTLKATGTEFDSSLPGSEPFTCQLRGGPGGVIDGWVAGIPGMKVGGKRRLNIPWRMAYGEMGNGPKIPGKSDLVFEVEVVGLK